MEENKNKKTIDFLNSLSKKQKVSMIVVIIFILLFIVVEIIVNSGANRNAKIKIGTELYNKAYDLYSVGKGIEIEKDEEGNLVYIEEEYETSLKYKIPIRYYSISNYDELKDLFTSSALKQLKKDLNIIEKDGKYYFKEISDMNDSYLKTELKIKSIHLLSVKFKAISSYCEEGYRVSYGTGCSEYKRIKKKEETFTMVFSGKWRISSFTKSK